MNTDSFRWALHNAAFHEKYGTVTGSNPFSWKSMLYGNDNMSVRGAYQGLKKGAIATGKGVVAKRRAMTGWAIAGGFLAPVVGPLGTLAGVAIGAGIGAIMSEGKASSS